MKTLFKVLVFFVLCASVRAVETKSAILTITNNPMPASVLSISGVTLTVTNGTPASTAFIQFTNGAPVFTTNLYTRMNGIVYTNVNSVTYSNATNLIISGISGMPLTVTVSGPVGTNFASVTYFTNQSASAYNLVLPFSTANIPNKLTNIHGDVVNILSYANGTNKVTPTAPAFTNYPASGRAYNPPITNMSVYGGTSAPTYLLATGGGYLDGVTFGNNVATNFSALGTGFRSTRIGRTGSVFATNDYTIAIGDNIHAWGIYDIVIGNTMGVEGGAGIGIGAGAGGDVTVPGGIFLGFNSGGMGVQGLYGIAIGVDAHVSTNHDLGVALGAFAATTRSNQIRLGASQDVSIPNNLDVNGFAFSKTNWATNLLATTAVIGTANIGAGNTTNTTVKTASLIAGAGTVTNLTSYSSSQTNASIQSQGVLGSAVTNAIHAGTNVWSGDVAYPPFSITTLAAGNNIAVEFGTNHYVTLDGSVAGGVLCGIVARGRSGLEYRVKNNLGSAFTLTQNTSDPTPANRFSLYLSTDVSIPSGGWFDLSYNTTISRWEIQSAYPVTASATNVPGSAISGLLTPLQSTNYTTGTFYTNNTGKVMDITISYVSTDAAVLGVTQIAVEVPGSTTNFSFPMLTAIAGVTGSFTSTVPAITLTNGMYFRSRDASSGIGNSATSIWAMARSFP